MTEGHGEPFRAVPPAIKQKGITLTIELSPETERRFAAVAHLSGRSQTSFARELIEDHIDALEDRLVAGGAIERSTDCALE